MKKLSRSTPCQEIIIKQPRWKDRTVLIAKYKIGTHNKIIFTDTPSMTEEYYISGEEAMNCPLTHNGKLDCHAVPLDDLEILERV